MATTTRKTVKKAIKKVNKPNVAKKVNESLISASMAAINTTIDNGEKWQKLASKLIKRSEKIRAQQINMIFDTAEAVKGQFITGTERVKELVGYDAELVEKAKDFAMKNPVSKKVITIVEDITETVSENPMVQKAEKATEDLKNMGVTKYREIKEDVLEQASKIVDMAEHKIDDAIEELKKEAKKATPKKKAKVTKAKVAKKVTKTETKAKSKPAPKRKVTTKTAITDDLKLINGIGPKTVAVFNKNGVDSFEKLSKLKTPEIIEILEKEGVRFTNTQVEIWQKQAQVAVKEGIEGLTKWIENYKTS
ncbi:hypothetical protein [Winogradskyella alexanderae]|uniref:Flap endonuclease-1-like 5' DNA nuclease n=1 Tax=Winogradskyella alexanderae TaxID=2877123 RepID=A0ABS7XX08_9FLAO|nr:hypothetical protein [Winogradskyella alexanderae]MCA0133536.1 hypothetical protein [Winogradskyella alexanderae]